MGILPGITSLMQYVNLIETKPVPFRLERCLNCGKAHPWLHGSYPRQADRENPSTTSFNPVPIQRYYCQTCEKTCSVLPECIPPRRWYLWVMQQAVFLLYLAGNSIFAIAKTALPSRQTIGRWIKRFKEQFNLHKDTLCHFFIDVGRSAGMTDFWLAVFNTVDLAEAMRLCHEAGVFIP
jgi:transposase-like protein